MDKSVQFALVKKRMLYTAETISYCPDILMSFLAGHRHAGIVPASFQQPTDSVTTSCKTGKMIGSRKESTRMCD
jgi:hypothetical protein